MKGDGAFVRHHQVELALIRPDHWSQNLAKNIEELLARSALVSRAHFTREGTTALDQTARVPLPFAARSGPSGPKTGIWRALPGANQGRCYLPGGPGLRWT